jgi:hypothetical protein
MLHSFDSFAVAADEAFLARIYAGIHFRTACRDGHQLGVAVGNYVVANAALSGDDSTLHHERSELVPARKRRGFLCFDGNSPALNSSVAPCASGPPQPME